MIYPKPVLIEFIEKSGKYLALINRNDTNYTNYLTMFIVEDVNKAEKEIEEVIADLGECTETVWNYDRIDFFIESKGWYFLVDYSGAVIEC